MRCVCGWSWLEILGDDLGRTRPSIRQRLLNLSGMNARIPRLYPWASINRARASAQGFWEGADAPDESCRSRVWGCLYARA